MPKFLRILVQLSSATSSVYRMGEFARRRGRSAGALSSWEPQHWMASRRAPSQQRSLTASARQPAAQLGFGKAAQRIAVYCRLSSADQEDDLAFQIPPIEQFRLSGGLGADEWVQEAVGVHTFSWRLSGLLGCGKTPRNEMSGGAR